MASFIIALCLLIVTTVSVPSEVPSEVIITLVTESSDISGPETPNPVGITLYFDVIYKYSLSTDDATTLYTIPISMFAITGTHSCKVPKIRFINDHSDGIYIDKIKVITTTGTWFGIEARCIDDTLIAAQPRVSDADWLNIMYEANAGCESSGTTNTAMCIDNEDPTSDFHSCSPYKQNIYFDLNRPNQYIDDAIWEDALVLTNNEKKCINTEPTSSPTSEPTPNPTSKPTNLPTISPTKPPTLHPTKHPTDDPTKQPTDHPTDYPTKPSELIITLITESSDIRGPETSNAVGVTLYFDAIYEYSLSTDDATTVYTIPISMFAITGTHSCKVPKIRFINDDSNGIYIDKIKVITTTGSWFGIEARCIDDVLIAAQPRVSDAYWLNIMYEAHAGCTSSGTANTVMCIDNEDPSTDFDSCSPYEQNIYFDLNRPNQYIDDAIWEDAITLTNDEKNCINTEPTSFPTSNPTSKPTNLPTMSPTKPLTLHPTSNPTMFTTKHPTAHPTKHPTGDPTKQPTDDPTKHPTDYPTKPPTDDPTDDPTKHPTTPAPTAPAAMICGEHDFGAYNGEILEFRVSVLHDGDVTFDAINSNFYVTAMEAYVIDDTNKYTLLQMDNDGDQVIYLNNVQAGNYLFALYGDQQAGLQYDVRTTCTTKSPTRVPAAAPTAVTSPPTLAPTRSRLSCDNGHETGVYNDGDILNITVNVAYQSDVTYDASQSQFDLESISVVHIDKYGIETRRNMNAPNGNSITITQLEAGTSTLSIRGQSGQTGEYVLDITCVSNAPTSSPSSSVTSAPTLSPTQSPSKTTESPTLYPTIEPTLASVSPTKRRTTNTQTESESDEDEIKKDETDNISVDDITLVMIVVCCLLFVAVIVALVAFIKYKRKIESKEQHVADNTRANIQHTYAKKHVHVNEPEIAVKQRKQYRAKVGKFNVKSEVSLPLAPTIKPQALYSTSGCYDVNDNNTNIVRNDSLSDSDSETITGEGNVNVTEGNVNDVYLAKAETRHVKQEHTSCDITGDDMRRTEEGPEDGAEEGRSGFERQKTRDAVQDQIVFGDEYDVDYIDEYYE